MIRTRIRIPTSDHVELEFELAGVASRFAAFLIDVLLLSVLVIVMWLLIIATTTALLRSEISVAVGGALLLLASLLLFWFYFLLFEAVWRGQTPGKRIVGLRVLRDDGVPVGWRSSAIRNLVRTVDLIPPPTGFLGGAFALFHPLGKRLGDLAAGTIVVREKFAAQVSTDTSALWMERLEKGGSRKAVLLPGGHIEVGQLALVERFLRRRASLPAKQRRELAWSIAKPLLPLMGEDPERWRQRHGVGGEVETLLERLLALAQRQGRPNPIAEHVWVSSQKRQHWKTLEENVGRLHRGGMAALRRLSAQSLSRLLEDYRRITSDLARARSLGADLLTVDQINRLAVKGHNLIYGFSPEPEARAENGHWLTAFARAARRHPVALAISGVLLLGPGLAGYLSVQLHPELGFDLVPPEFLDFAPAREESLHDIPPLARPIAASSILGTNIQVSLSAFSLGLTAGIGTVLLMIYNGLFIGATAGWLTRAGRQRALWGWIMPHGSTELLAIIIAGAAGFLLAQAILSPGRLTRREALKQNAKDALILELGCMAMLVVAGFIEGFVSPSHIEYGTRVAVSLLTLLGWAGYLTLAGRGAAPKPAHATGETPIGATRREVARRPG